MYRMSQPTLGLINFDLFPSSDFLGAFWSEARGQTHLDLGVALKPQQRPGCGLCEYLPRGNCTASGFWVLGCQSILPGGQKVTQNAHLPLAPCNLAEQLPDE